MEESQTHCYARTAGERSKDRCARKRNNLQRGSPAPPLSSDPGEKRYEQHDDKRTFGVPVLPRRTGERRNKIAR